MKAGHARAYARLSQTMEHYRCPKCLEDVRRPPVDNEGVHCPYCGHIDTRRPVVLDQQLTGNGFRWVARLGEPHG